MKAGFGGELGAASAQRMAPCAWWKCYGACAPQLQFLAMRALSQPASASSAEQSWSQYDYVHNKRRNRLKTDVASKLCYVHQNLRLVRRLHSYERYKGLLEESVSMFHKLSYDEWEGNCSDNDSEDDGETLHETLSRTMKPKLMHFLFYPMKWWGACLVV